MDALALRVDERDVGGPGQPGAAMPVRVAPLAERVAAIAVRYADGRGAHRDEGPLRWGVHALQQGDLWTPSLP